jgi:branched-chain amino acid transport system ATP-binding protein
MSNGIDVEHLRAGYGSVEALHDVTLHFPLGSVVALLGRNGAGKSTLLRVIAGTVAASAGRVSWKGNDITRLPAHERAGAGLTVVPDGANVFADMSVAENLAVFGHGASTEPAYAVFPELVGKEGQRAGTLSGGERQMLALSRLLLAPGDALLLDEVSSGLSVGAIGRLYAVIAELATPRRTIVVVEQYQPDVVRRADVIYALARGEVAWAGEPGELRAGSLPLAFT